MIAEADLVGPLAQLRLKEPGRVALALRPTHTTGSATVPQKAYEYQKTFGMFKFAPFDTEGEVEAVIGSSAAAKSESFPRKQSQAVSFDFFLLDETINTLNQDWLRVRTVVRA